MASGTYDTVVLMIDEDRVRKVASSILHKAGFRVVELPSPAAASLERFDHGGNISLAIVDTDSSQQEASELIKRIHQILPESRVLLLSESTEIASLACRGQQGCWFMRKPFRRAQLLGRVLDVFAEPTVLTA